MLRCRLSLNDNEFSLDTTFVTDYLVFLCTSNDQMVLAETRPLNRFWLLLPP